MIYYAVIILISMIVFSRQERKHQFERSLFYTYEQLQKRIVIPVRDTLDSCLITFVGAILVEIGIGYIWTMNTVRMIKQSHNNNPKVVFNEDVMSVMIALFISGGIALFILGIRSVIANLRYKKLNQH
jgi:hypothetical protein